MELTSSIDPATERTTQPRQPVPGAPHSDNAASTYVVTELLYRSATGEVVGAYDSELGRTVALKRLPAARAHNRIHAQALRREARLLASVPHRHIVTLHSLHEDSEGPMLVMEQLQGESLRSHLSAHARLPMSEAMTFATHALTALAHLHARGMVHGAVQPSHLFLCEDGSTKLLDFGHAHSVHTLAPAVESSSADIVYRAPEQISDAPADARVDVYGLGISLCEALTGKTDCVAACAELTQRTDAAFVEIVRRACASDPAQRFADAGVMLDALNAYAIGNDDSAAAMPARAHALLRRAYNKISRGPRIELWLVGMALALFVALGLHPLKTKPPEDRAAYATERLKPAREKSVLKKTRGAKPADNKYGHLRKAWGNP